MVRFSFSLFAFCILLVHVESLTKFVFSGKMVCDKPDFDYHMVLWEKDSNSSDDAMSNQGPRASHEPHYYKIEGEQDGDEVFAFTYEVYMTIVHSCTHPEKPYRKLTVQLGEFPLMDGTNYKSVNFTLTNQGELTTDVIGFQGFAGKSD